MYVIYKKNFKLKMNNDIPLVAYIAYEPFGFEYFQKFLDNYNNYRSGKDHDLLICFKNFQSELQIKEWKEKINIKFVEFYEKDKPNDYDIGSYFRIAEQYPERTILFIGSHTRPIINDWLKLFFKNFRKNRVIGATASYASLSSQFLNFYYDNHSKYQQFKWGIYHLFNVKLFPNPHLRTNCFMIKGNDFLKLNFNRKKFLNKIETNYFEGGRRSLTNQLKKKGFEVLLLNSDGELFEIKDWKKSKTYCLGNQEKLIFIDNRTKEYQDANDVERKKFRKFTWGID